MADYIYDRFFGFAGSGLGTFNEYPFVHDPYYITPSPPPFVWTPKDLDFDFEPIPVTLQSQYSASPNIKALTEAFEDILPNEDIELFYEKIFNIYTAEGMGLDIWGRILGIGRAIQIAETSVFGFFGSGLSGFNQDPFTHEAATKTYEIPDYNYRKYLLITKAFANISGATAPELNYILSQIFVDKAAYVINNGTMRIRFIFEFYADAFEQNIFDLGLINRAAGVGYDYYQIPPDDTFGFAGSGLNTFNHGVFDVYGVKEI